MAKYRFIKKKTKPGEKDSPTKWYAAPYNQSAGSLETQSEEAAGNTTAAPKELELALDLFSKYAIKELAAGRTVKVGTLGTIRLSFSSKGVDDFSDFNAKQMIYNVKISFRPSQKATNELRLKTSFTNAGVVDGPHVYGTVQTYLDAKSGKTADNGGGSTDTGGTSGGSGGNTGGGGSDDDDDMS